METAVELIRDWCAARPIDGLSVDVQRLPGLTPLIVCEVAPTDPCARRPHRAAVRPPRQAAGDDGLARRPRAVDARDRGRPALRPRRRRRRLRRLRRARSPSRPPKRRASPTPACSCSSRPARRAAAPTCRRTSRRWPIASARPSSSSASTPDASTTSGCGSRRRCAAWSAATSRSRSSTPARTAARRAASCRRASGSSASCSTAIEDATTGPRAAPRTARRDPRRPPARGERRRSRRSRSARPTSSRSPAPRGR